MTDYPMNRFQRALARKNTERPPVWFMRQAGRYHSHYQELRKRHSFLDLCERPWLACEVAMGPVLDFDFDAAILFSDILFPLRTLGMGLHYDERPRLDWYLREPQDLHKLREGGAGLARELEFQGEALALTREKLSRDKGLIGFVGGPLTLFFYAVEGSHQGDLASAKAGMHDGRFEGFTDRLLDLLAENMAIQARAGADTIAILDTCAGEVSPVDYGKQVIPVLRDLISRFRARCPETPVTYYSKGTGPQHWAAVSRLPVACLGVDWNHDLVEVLRNHCDQCAIQGNIDPNWLLLDHCRLEPRLRAYFSRIRELPAHARQGWIGGLGHGVLPKTPEDNVRLFVRLFKEYFGDSGGAS